MCASTCKPARNVSVRQCPPPNAFFPRLPLPGRSYSCDACCQLCVHGRGAQSRPGHNTAGARACFPLKSWAWCWAARDVHAVCPEHMRVTLHARAHLHCLPLTKLPSASTGVLPPPPRTIVDIGACHTPCEGRAVCCSGRPCRKGGGRTGGTSISNASTRIGVRGVPHPLPLSRLPLSTERQHRQTRQQSVLVGRGERHLHVVSRLHRCTVR